MKAISPTYIQRITINADGAGHRCCIIDSTTGTYCDIIVVERNLCGRCIKAVANAD